MSACGGDRGKQWENDRIQNRSEQVRQVTQERRHCAGNAVGKGVPKNIRRNLKNEKLLSLGACFLVAFIFLRRSFPELNKPNQ